MSPRAAWRLESLGFTQVFDYVAGKKDWFASGLPREGSSAGEPRAGDVARKDVPTCGLTDRLADVRDRVREAGWNTCVVVSEERVVLGRLRSKALSADAEATVEEVIQPGPRTIRPSVRAKDLPGWLRERKLGSVLVTTSDGRLVGLVRREDLEERMGA